MRKCTECGSTVLVAYQSLLLWQCEDCKSKMPWKKKENEPPLIGNNRQRTQAQE